MAGTQHLPYDDFCRPTIMIAVGRSARKPSGKDCAHGNGPLAGFHSGVHGLTALSELIILSECVFALHAGRDLRSCVQRSRG